MLELLFWRNETLAEHHAHCEAHSECPAGNLYDSLPHDWVHRLAAEGWEAIAPHASTLPPITAEFHDNECKQRLSLTELLAAAAKCSVLLQTSAGDPSAEPGKVKGHAFSAVPLMSDE